MNVHDEARVVELLAPLRRIEPVHPPEPARKAGRRPVVVAAVAAAALVIAGIAIAAGIGAFNGIGAAQHPRLAQDIIDPKTARFLKQAPPGLQPAFLLNTSRLVGHLPSGRRIWVITDARDELCVVVEREGYSCGGALSTADPITRATFDRDGPWRGEPAVSFGVARDGVTAISFIAHGREVTVPVKNNVWVYVGGAAVLRSATVHYADGTTTTLHH